MNRFESFTLAPLSAGDIIDRAIQIYRRQFLPLLQIVLWPSLVAYAGVVALTFGMQNFSFTQGDGRIILSVLLAAVGFITWAIGKISFYVVLGGTSRALVNYFLDGTPLRPREVYRAVRERFWSLVGATLMVMVIAFATFSALYMVLVMAVMMYVFLVTWALSALPLWFQVIMHTILGGAFLFALLLLGLMVFKRVIFIPQALMVEGRGVFSAIGRSFTLAGRDVRHIGAIVLFDAWLTGALLTLLVLPLGGYAWLNGVNLFSDAKPIWYEIVYQTLSQISEILLAPIAMLGFTLLYIDARVRREGFDIELLANRQLAPAPEVAPNLPPVMTATTIVAEKTAHSILGLDEVRVRGDQPATTLQSASARPFVCRNCGNSVQQISDLDRFCQICGAAFETRSVSATEIV